jgi:hypothetical protein
MKYRDKSPTDDITENQTAIVNKISAAIKYMANFLVPLSRDA